MTNLKSSLQSIGENLAYQAKGFFKSYELSIFLQYLFLVLPVILTLISMYCNGVKLLDYMSFGISILAFIYYMYAGKNTELFKAWGEKYLALYHETQHYYRTSSPYKKNQIDEFLEKKNLLGMDNSKPNLHIFAFYIARFFIDEEMRHGNEKEVWWKQK